MAAIDLQQIDLSGLDRVEPRDLITNPNLLRADTQAAARALAYARLGDNSYETIAFRTFAAAPRVGPAPLQTSSWGALQRRLFTLQKSDAVVDEILEQQTKLRHRPIALPEHVDEWDYTLNQDVVQLITRSTDAEGRQIEEEWSFALTDPPAALLMGAYDRDEQLIGAQQALVLLEGTHWLPFSVLLSEGRFPRFQEVRDRVERLTIGRNFYCFLSHRWLDTRQPDPDALQARFAAWQILAHLATAVRVAAQRGLHTPRRFSASLGVAVGPRGNDFAEALIVNLLRQSLDDELLQQAVDETAELETVLADYGVSEAATDSGLEELNALLTDRPVLRALCERIFLWYDYSCIPQPPRDAEDEPLFRKGLQELTAAQLISRTVIMLDDADDYLSRAWCTLEAITADTGTYASDLIVGSRRPTTAQGEVEHYFRSLLQDRPHVVWRGVLDTEVFRIQPPDVCLDRLGLRVTDRKDLPFIYERLKGLGGPLRIHIDDSEIITGVLPLPVIEDGNVILRVLRTGRAFRPDADEPDKETLDWTKALSLGAERDIDLAASAAPFRAVNPVGDNASCHIAVVGSCEAEAILLTDWVRRNYPTLEERLRVSVTGLSWLASDIAPIGHLPVGTLRVQPIDARCWIVITTSARLRHCRTTSIMTETLRWTGIPHVTIAIDQTSNNVEFGRQTQFPPGTRMRDFIAGVRMDGSSPPVHVGGLFQWQVLEEVL